MDTSDKITWQRTTNTTWTLWRAHRGYTATITLGAKPNPYSIQIVGPGGNTTAWPTLRAAKNQFRKFLMTKPVG